MPELDPCPRRYPPAAKQWALFVGNVAWMFGAMFVAHELGLSGGPWIAAAVALYAPGFTIVLIAGRRLWRGYPPPPLF